MKPATLLIALWTATADALSTAEWKKQSIYQVLTDRFARSDGSTTVSCIPTAGAYCGGTWAGITDKLDYIQGMGFTAIWISPVVKNLEGMTADGAAYHGYWAQDIWSLNSNFGTDSDLVDLSAALHSRGMYLMLDVVTNHMGYDGCGECVDYSIFNPFSSSSYFHPYAEINYDNVTSIQTGWEGDNIVSLPDLRTEDSDVRDIFNDWIEQMVAMYSVDGLRIDSAKHVEESFWPGFEDASGVFNIGEVLDGNADDIYPWLDYLSGVLNYPVYYWITRAFESTSATMTELVDGINAIKANIDTSTLGSFMENHDNPRFPSYTSDMALVKNAIAFTMLSDGIPIIYYGQEQHYAGGASPASREALWSSGYSTASELYTWIGVLNEIRHRAVAQDADYLSYEANPIYSDSHSIVLRKGAVDAQVISAFTNMGANGSSYAVTLASAITGFTASQVLIEVMGCTSVTTDASGNLALDVGPTTKVLYPLAQLEGSGICPDVTG